jgi:hypothetical protein
MIYRFKVWFDDDEDIARWLDMKPTNTFKEFHEEILKSINFKDTEPASFYLANSRWIKGFEITLQDMGFDDSDEPKVLMKDCLIKDFVNDPHQRFIYINDFMQMWTLHIELQRIMEEEKGKTYPRLFKSEGEAPKQQTDFSKLMILDESELDLLAEELIAEKGGRKTDIELVGLDEEDDLDDNDEEDEDEFGPSYGDGLDESDNIF